MLIKIFYLNRAKVYEFCLYSLRNYLQDCMSLNRTTRTYTFRRKHFNLLNKIWLRCDNLNKKKWMILFFYLLSLSSISLYSGIILFLIMHSILFYTPTPLQWMIIRFTRYNVTYLTREPVVRLWTDAFSPRTVEIRICLLKRWIRTYLLNADTDLCPKWFLRNTFVVS